MPAPAIENGSNRISSSGLETGRPPEPRAPSTHQPARVRSARRSTTPTPGFVRAVAKNSSQLTVSIRFVLCVLCVLCGQKVFAQFQMPDPRVMSGIPRPDEAQPSRTVSVRVIRGELSNNLPNQPVDLLVNGTPQTVRTGEDGRAQFTDLVPGARLKAVTVVDGERIESQEFAAPGAREPGI